MKRVASASAACLLFLCAATASGSQPAPGQAAASKASATTGGPSATATAPPKFAKIVKGDVTVDVLRGNPKKVGNDMVTSIKVKNTSNGAIAGFKVEEYWYDKKPKPDVVTGDTQIYKKPINPGEIVEIIMKSPLKPGVELYQSKYQFTHANGKVTPQAVKKF
jgi:hypothetical protein